MPVAQLLLIKISSKSTNRAVKRLSLGMQGEKKYTEKLFTSFQLSDRVPESNFYRQLKERLNLEFMRDISKGYYGNCGQKSIDPVVFMKLMLAGYMENICSDRQLMQHCAMRMDILYFLGYDIDEPLPCHSTLSRTRNLLPETLFEECFSRVLSMCVASGMVSGHTQAIDSAPIKANASMDSLELKVASADLEEYLQKVRAQSRVDRQTKSPEEKDEPKDKIGGVVSPSGEPRRKAKQNRAKEADREVQASKQELQEIAARNKNWRSTQTERPGARNKNSKYTSNKTHYSPVDPDARISVKPGKARKLNYHAQMAVDTAHHVITHLEADYADRVDSLSLPAVVNSLESRLRNQGLLWRNVLADAGYSSGENYAMLEERGMQTYIPPHGTYKGGPAGFSYHEAEDYWECARGEKVTFRKIQVEKSGNKKKLYLTKPSQCKGCPQKTTCIGKSPEKRITITAYRAEYERVKARLKSKRGKQMRSKRSSTVEPVFGTLTQFMGLRKINTRGKSNASKCMLCAAMAYNLKKYLKFSRNKAEVLAKAAQSSVLAFISPYRLILSPNPTFNF